MDNGDMIKILVVDDSAFMRKAITNMLQTDQGIQVVGTARDGLEGIQKIQELKPDLVTLDIEMPRMNGIEALRVIMDQMPLPVLIVSSVSEEEARAAMDALDLGAIDFIPKNLDDGSLNIMKIRNDLIQKIRSIASRKSRIIQRVKNSGNTPRPQKILNEQFNRKKDGHIQRIRAVAIGTSTGGPKALQEVIPLLPKDFPCGVLIVQHMPAAFISHFSERLNQMSHIEVKMAEQNDLIKSGLVLIAPGDFHMKAIKKSATETRVELTKNPSDLLHRPSVDVMMRSVAEFYPGRSLGVIMTGMGHDGQDGMRMIKENNGRTIAQDEETCVVFGMPKAAIDINVIDKIVPLSHIAGEIVNMV
jgi:two-component system chemotaxis response regulator CheB